jgi:hypothetical protein
MTKKYAPTKGIPDSLEGRDPILPRAPAFAGLAIYLMAPFVPVTC